MRDFDIGKLREVIKFEKNIPGETESGGETDSFAEFLTTRGMLRKKRGNRGLEAGAVLLTSDYELVVRYQKDIADNLAGDSIRIVAQNRFFTIDSYDIYEQRFNFYVFQLSEQSI